MRARHYRGVDGREILPDGRRPLWFVIRDTIAALVSSYPDIFPLGKAWIATWRSQR